MCKQSKLLAIVALVALCVSCSNDDPEPKARFSYEVNELTVTFTNLSKDANSYEWTFGDGSAVSTEANPVHTYADGGTFTVKLKAINGSNSNETTDAIVLSAAKPLIVVDGNFSDWDEVPANKLAQATVPNGNERVALKEVKACADDLYIYFYMQIDKTNAGPAQIYFDTDNNGETGWIGWFWDPCGSDCLIEVWNYEVFAEEATLTIWPPGVIDNTIDWIWDEGERSTPAGLVTISDFKTVSGNIIAFEGKIVREMVSTNFANEIGMGFGLSNSDWTNIGFLPILADNALAPMLKVKMN